MSRKLVSSMHEDFWVPVVKFYEMHAESFLVSLFIHLCVDICPNKTEQIPGKAKLENEGWFP